MNERKFSLDQYTNMHSLSKNFKIFNDNMTISLSEI
jgi:hypothetical protein